MDSFKKSLQKKVVNFSEKINLPYRKGILWGLVGVIIQKIYDLGRTKNK